MRSLVALVVLCTAVLGADHAAGEAQRAPQLVVKAWTKPLPFTAGLAFLPDGRALVTEKDSGVVRVIERSGTARAKPFAKIDVYSKNEYGALGVTVDPEFARFPFVYIYYVQGDASGEKPRRARLVRYRWRNGVGVNRRVLVDDLATNDFNTHVGGSFAWQGSRLLVTVGDGSPARPTSGPAQVRSSTRGKVLRMTRDGKPAPGNPYGTLVYSIGHRNSYGITVDRKTGAIFETENGSDQSDEVNRIVRGGNYGWPLCQGFDTDCVEPKNYVAPMWESGNVTVAPTSIVSYHGSRIPALRGKLVWCAFNTGELFAFGLTPNQRKITSIETFRGDNWRCGASLREAADGALVFSDLTTGRLIRIVGSR
jgi:glucose/arabinose dehydrogenase